MIKQAKNFAKHNLIFFYIQFAWIFLNRRFNFEIHILKHIEKKKISCNFNQIIWWSLQSLAVHKQKHYNVHPTLFYHTISFVFITLWMFLEAITYCIHKDNYVYKYSASDIIYSFSVNEIFQIQFPSYLIYKFAVLYLLQTHLPSMHKLCLYKL